MTTTDLLLIVIIILILIYISRNPPGGGLGEKVKVVDGARLYGRRKGDRVLSGRGEDHANSGTGDCRACTFCGAVSYFVRP